MLLLYLVVATNLATAEAQWLIPPTAPYSPRAAAPPAFPAAPPAEASTERLVLHGALLGLGGFVAGWIVGGRIGERCDHAEDLCIEDEEVYGAAAGGTLGLVTGVHLGNRRRGSFVADLLAASAVWVAGMVTANLLSESQNDDATLAVLIAIPIVQFGTTVAVERSTARTRRR